MKLKISNIEDFLKDEVLKNLTGFNLELANNGFITPIFCNLYDKQKEDGIWVWSEANGGYNIAYDIEDDDWAMCTSDLKPIGHYESFIECLLGL